MRRGRVAVGLGFLGVGAAALLLRDRILPLAALTYFPVPLFAGAAGLFFIRTGRRSLLALAVLLGLGGAYEMSGFRLSPGRREGRPLRVVQQNVWWGGGYNRSRPLWHDLEASLVHLGPDVLVLAEMPEDTWRKGMRARLAAATGRTWSVTCGQGRPKDPNLYRVAIVSPYPHADVAVHALEDGLLLDVTLVLPEGPLRVWAVDGLSHLSRDRRRMLGDLAARVTAAEAAGRPVDLLAGDFNAPAKSVGFNALRAKYWLAGEHSFAWRATWPSIFPLVDVDHIWLRREVLGGQQVRFRTDARLDHRGQVVDALWTPAKHYGPKGPPSEGDEVPCWAPGSTAASTGR